MGAREDSLNEMVKRYGDALRILADPLNWSGDPFDQDATLHGHFTPYELARLALRGDGGHADDD